MNNMAGMCEVNKRQKQQRQRWWQDAFIVYFVGVKSLW